MTLSLIPKRTINNEGKPSGMWNLISWNGKKPWALSWHKRNPHCRRGWYYNKTTSIGLKACLNLPIFGDFSLWLYWKPAPKVKSVGEQIIDDIIRNGLVRAECEGLSVWKANSPEVLEAIVVKHAPKLMRELKSLE